MMNKKIIWIILIIIAAVSLAYIFLQMNSTTSNNSSNIFLCKQDTDCVFVCGSCENVTYFHSNPPSACDVAINQTASRMCFCNSNECVALGTEIQPPNEQPESKSLFNFYVLVAVAIVITLVFSAVFISHLMKSPPEMWSLVCLFIL